MDNIKWGILGPGWIARQFAQGLQARPDAELVAVGSRSQERADRFGDEFGVARRYSSYEALALAEDIDVIYVATPHPEHAAIALLCLQGGKAVLCEKPFTMNATQAQAVIDLAEREQKFLMEGMWTRYLPAMVRVREMLATGAIGDPLMLQADFGFRADFAPQGRLFAPELGGGALLDLGSYVVSLASMLFGEPDRTTALTQLGVTGVDEHTAIILGYPGGQLASLEISLRTTTPQTATILGTASRIHIPAPWWKPSQLQLTRAGNAMEIIELPFAGNGYNYEAEEVMRCLRAGELESATMPLNETLAIMQTLDRIRASWGLRYPIE